MLGLVLLLLAGCAPPSSLGDFGVTVGDDGLLVTGADGGVLLDGLRVAVGTGDEALEMLSGSYRVLEGETTWIPAEIGRLHGQDPVLTAPLESASGDKLGSLTLVNSGSGLLRIELQATAGNRVRWDAPCTGDDHFAGLGEHVDVDHVGEAFPLWVSEPGIGKTADEAEPDDWFLTGTRHASSYPDPFLVRPEPLGVAVGTTARIEVDLCTGPRWTLDVWDDGALFLLFDGDSPLDIVQAHALAAGTPVLPPDWAFAPWNDAIGGTERVTTVANELRASGASSSVIWTEDWKGGEDSLYGYHLLLDWDLDATLYPDATGTDAALEAAGFKWLAYFSPFVGQNTDDWASVESLVIEDAEGAPYLFTGASFEPTSVLDLSRAEAAAWAEAKMYAALAIGFDGWMADFGEWIPPDASFAHADAVTNHNAYPAWWQSTNQVALADADALMFTRSGWTGTPTLSPITWAGDQRTSFDADDGLPTVVPLGLGAGIAGVPLYGHDVGGYQSIGNDPSTKELWFRWCTLGAFTPIMRTHHGAFAADNWQFDSDAETLALWARYSNLHAQLYPYLRGLAAQAVVTGRPLVLAPFLVYPEEPWSRTDAWLLGTSLFVAPVTEEGALGREISLPTSTSWYHWWTGAAAVSGYFPVALDSIAVFAPAGAIVPLFTTPPDSLVPGPLDGLITLTEADLERTIRVFSGAKGAFTEADGTTYETDGVATGSGTSSAALTSGTLSAGGLTLTIAGEIARTYTLVVN